MKKFICYFGLLLWMPSILIAKLNAQSLQVGDKLEGIQRTKSSTKLVILDFWSTGCYACIRAFPKLQDLQKAFPTDVEVVLVTNEKEQAINDFFKKHNKFYRPSLRSIYGDTVLNAKFPEYGYPFQVWVDNNDRIVTITETADVSTRTIDEFLKGGNAVGESAIKKKKYSSLIQAGFASWNAPVPYYSYIAKCSDSISVGHSNAAHYAEGFVRISDDCASAVQLYKTAYSEKGKYRFDNDFSVILDIADPWPYTKPKEQEALRVWKTKNRYSYELIVPKERSAGIFQMMQEDLARYFGLKATMSKGPCKFIQLLDKPGPNLLKTKGGTPSTEVVYVSNNNQPAISVKLRNKPFDTLCYILWKNLPDIPIQLEDRSSYRDLGNIDIEFSLRLDKKNFVDDLREVMHRYNLRVFAYDTRIDILILSDKK